MEVLSFKDTFVKLDDLLSEHSSWTLSLSLLVPRARNGKLRDCFTERERLVLDDLKNYYMKARRVVPYSEKIPKYLDRKHVTINFDGLR